MNLLCNYSMERWSAKFVKVVETHGNLFIMSCPGHELTSLSFMKQAPYYETELVPLLEQSKVLYFTHADSRLANNDLPDYIQQLRCRVNYRALRYSEPIRHLANTLTNRLRDDNPYLALHLRYSIYTLCISYRACFHCPAFSDNYCYTTS